MLLLGGYDAQKDWSTQIVVLICVVLPRRHTPRTLHALATMTRELCRANTINVSLSGTILGV